MPLRRFEPTGAAFVSVALAAALLVASLAGCPRLPPVSGCTPGEQRCAGDAPEVCSATRRWHRAGDAPCAAVGGACVTDGGVAYCTPADGGAR
jgi:hypothetical protein